MPPLPAAALHIYRALVYLYPPAFRREFASEMTCDFHDATCDAWRDGRWLAVVPLWIHIGHDLASTVAAQWFRHGSSVVTLLSVLGMTMCGIAITRLAGRPRRAIALSPADEAEMVMLFLATMVILLAAAVVTFTVCFQLLVLRRKGQIRRV